MGLLQQLIASSHGGILDMFTQQHRQCLIRKLDSRTTRKSGENFASEFQNTLTLPMFLMNGRKKRRFERKFSDTELLFSNSSRLIV